MANLLDGSQRERSPKHGKAAEKSLLPLTEQVMTPVDGCGESLLARDPAATSREEAKAVGEALENLSGSEMCGPGSGKFDGERDAIKATADLGDSFLGF